MSQLRVRPRRIAIIGIVGIASLIAIIRTRRSTRRPFPSANELMAMSDPEFEAFIAATGLRTATSAGLTIEDR